VGRTTSKVTIAGLFLATAAAWTASSGELERARECYNRTDYRGSLEVLTGFQNGGAAGLFLAGQDHFMLGDYKRSAEAFQKAAAVEPSNSDFYLWLGRAYGRRAEMANPLSAAGYASKARQSLERSVELNPSNKEALDDLFDYYLQAPGFMGGGLDKAAAVARQIGAIDVAEGHYALSQLAEKKKEYNTAEEQLRRAVSLAPLKVGRIIELARFLAKQGRYQESDAVFDRAERMAPNSPRVMFAKAMTLVQSKRNLDEARHLLRAYIQSDRLTPADPPRTEAEQLLRRASGD
jgi:tetratricopeptide (TPR) repeat protein